jgi:hypothetical protein
MFGVCLRGLEPDDWLQVSPQVDDGGERFGYLVAHDLNTVQAGHVDLELCEQQSVKGCPLPDASSLVQLGWVFEVVQDPVGIAATGLKLFSSLAEAGLEATPLITDFHEPLGQPGYVFGVEAPR